MLVINVALLLDYLWFKYSLLLLFGDIDLNPEPKQNTARKFSIYYWNLSSIAAHNFAKLVFLKVYNLFYKLDIICLRETYLDSSILPDHSNLKIPRYILVRSHDPSNEKMQVFVYTTRVICL